METWKIKYEEERTLGEFFAFLLFWVLAPKKHEIKTHGKKKKPYQLAVVTQKLSFLSSTLLKHLIHVVLI